MTSEGNKFKMEGEEKKSIDKIKRCLENFIIQAHFDPEKDVKLYTDASSEGIGGILVQEGRPIWTFNRKLNPSQRRYSTIEREMLALKTSINHFRRFLLGRHFEAHTDHKPLLGMYN